MPVYNEAIQTEYKSVLGKLLKKYGVDVSPVKDSPAFDVEFFDLVIQKDRREFKALLSVLKDNLTSKQLLALRDILLEHFPEYTAEIGG